MRVPMIAGNWKMNTTVSEAIELTREMRPELDAIDNVEKVICPPFQRYLWHRQFSLSIIRLIWFYYVAFPSAPKLPV